MTVLPLVLACSISAIIATVIARRHMNSTTPNPKIMLALSLAIGLLVGAVMALLRGGGFSHSIVLHHW